MLSTITPPVALSAFVAAGIAEANQNLVGYTAFKLAIPGFIVPYMFVYGPSLLLIGSYSALITTIPTAVIGILSLACAAQGWFLGRLTLYSRFAFLLAALFLIKPGLSSDLIGVLLLIVFTTIQYFKKQNKTKRLV